MNDIHELLTLLHRQDGASLGRKSAEVLNAYLQGFAFAKRFQECAEDQEFLDTFNGWVHQRYNFSSSTQGWAKIVAFQADSEAAEWALFWKLYEEFMAKRNKRGTRAEHTAAK